MVTKLAIIHVEKAIHSSATSVTLEVKGRKANPSATLSFPSMIIFAPINQQKEKQEKKKRGDFLFSPFVNAREKETRRTTTTTEKISLEVKEQLISQSEK